MVELKNSEKGKRCFIIGTGSSINEQDLILLKDEIVIGVSGLFMHKDINIIKPKYYVLTSVFEYHKHFNKEAYYINWLSDMEQILDKKTTYFLADSDKPYFDKYNLFQDKNVVFQTYKPYRDEEIRDIDFSNFSNTRSVSGSAIKVALYLGFDEIFLLGFDHDWFENVFIHYNGEEYLKYFEYHNVNSMRDTHGIDSVYQMERHIQLFKEYKKFYAMKENIYNANANPNTYVDTFPKVSLDKLFVGNYKEYLHMVKKEFIRIENIILSQEYKFSIDFNKFYDQIISLENKDILYIIYGNGKISKTIQKLIPDKILGYVDIADEKNHPNSLKYKQFDKIIISVLGREKEIIEYLTKDLGVKDNKIITFSF